MKNHIDHFGIGAQTLEQGVAHLQSVMGVEVPRGSKHDAMGTHNCVAPAGNECFLEIITIDPNAPAPSRKRWFTLDDPATQSQLAQKPRPLCWVVRTEDLDRIIENSPIDLGEAVLFTRGDRSWRITIPPDGGLPEQGLLPAFIQWSPGPHPSLGMTDIGISLESIHLGHPEPDYLSHLLVQLGVDHLANVEYSEKHTLRFTVKNLLGESIHLVG